MTRLAENRIQAYLDMVLPGAQHRDTLWLNFAIQHMSLIFEIEEQQHCAEIFWQDSELSGSLLESHRRCWGRSPKWHCKLQSGIFVCAVGKCGGEGGCSGVFVNGEDAGQPQPQQQQQQEQQQQQQHQQGTNNYWGPVLLLFLVSFLSTLGALALFCPRQNNHCRNLDWSLVVVFFFGLNNHT